MDRIDRSNSEKIFSIEKCTDTSAALTLESLAAETFMQAFGQLYMTEDLELFLQKNHTENNYCTLITDPAYLVWLTKAADGKAVGYMVTGPCRLPAPGLPDNSGELIRFYILDEYQGRGLGKRMLTDALVWLEGNFQHIYLSVYAENHGAQRLYSRFGFEKIHKYLYMVGNQADPEFIMKRC